MSVRPPIIRRKLCTAVAAAFLSVAVAHAGELSLDIPAADLGAAINQLARQANVQVLFAASLVAGKKAPALKGAYTPESALRALLAGSGIELRNSGGAFALVAAQANHDWPEHGLSEVTVVATKTRSPVDATPASVSIAGQERFDEMQTATILPVVKAMPNVELGGGPRVDGLIPTIRGAYGASVTLLLDGARQNDLQAQGMKSPLYTDPYFLKQIEVLRGASSSLYGSGGNGGVMALTTLSARDLLDEGQRVGGGVKYGRSSGDSSSHLNARLYVAGEVVDALIAVGKHDWDRIRLAGGGHLDPNDGSSDAGLIKVGLSPRRDLRFELSHQFYESDNLAPNNPQVSRYKLTSDPFARAIPYIQPTHVSQYNTVLKGESGDADAANGPHIEGSVYQSYLKIRLDPYATNPAFANAAITTVQITQTKTDGATMQVTTSLGDHRLVAGADLFSDRLDSRSGTTVNAVNPAGIREGLGAFLQDEIKLATGWKVTPTLRYDRYDASSSSGTWAPNKKSRFSPKGTLSWGDDNGLLAYGSLGQGFRAPSVNELFQNSQVGIFSYFYPNPGLGPEIDRTTEIGAKMQLRNLQTEGDVLRLRGAIFNSRVHDLISSITLGQINAGSTCYSTGTGCMYQYQNIANARRHGAEIEAAYSRNLWQANLAYGRVRVANSDTGENLFSPPDKLTAKVQRRLPDYGLSLLWNGSFVAAQDYDGTPLRRRSGYSVHDVFLSWTPAGQSRYRVDAGITNLFDHAYVAYQSANMYAYTYQEGRSLKLSVSADF